MFVRQAAAIVVLAALLGSSPVRAASEGSNAIAITAGISAVLGIACWTADIMAREKEGRHAVKDDRAFDRRGFYLDVNGVAGDWRNRDDEYDDKQETQANLNADVSIENPRWGLGGQAGYRCNSRFSVEGEIEWLSTFKGSFGNDQLGQISSLEYDYIIYGANFKGYILTGRLQPYALIGAGTSHVESKDVPTQTPTDVPEQTSLEQTAPQNDGNAEFTMFSMRFGGGLDIYLTPNIVLNGGVEYILPVTGQTNFKYISYKGGLGYRF